MLCLSACNVAKLHKTTQKRGVIARKCRAYRIYDDTDERHSKNTFSVSKTHKHGSPAETKPDSTIFTQRGKNGLHPSRPQTLFKSSENIRNGSLCQNCEYLAFIYVDSNYRPIACPLQSTKRACRSKRIDAH